MIELFALILSLVLGILKTSLSTLPCPLFNRQLCSELLVLLFNYAQGLAGLGTKVGLDPNLVLGVFHPFLSCEHLLDGLHKYDEQARY